MLILNQIKKYVPHPIKEALYCLSTIFKKPELWYIELHLTDHCNMNCKGCGHFSSLAPQHYADLDQYNKDMRRLKQLFPGGIKTIRLMGGEPLLHPDAAKFMIATREIFPLSDLRFCTNGILLPKASSDFWDACRTTKTIIDFTIYPPVQKYLNNYLALCKAQSVDYTLIKFSGDFLAHLNLSGTSDKKKSFQICRRFFRCPFLQAGRLYHCAMPALIYCFNEKFGYKIIADEGVDIHSPMVTGSKILRKLRRPIITCNWCAYEFVPFRWTVTQGRAEEWEADFHRK